MLIVCGSDEAELSSLDRSWRVFFGSWGFGAILELGLWVSWGAGLRRSMCLRVCGFVSCGRVSY